MKMPPRYDLKTSVEVMFRYRRYFVWLDQELVVGEVLKRNGKVVIRRVTSREIETAALLRASDKFHSEGTT